MKNRFCYIYCLLVLSFSLSCSKDSGTSKATLLTAGTWKIIAFDIEPGRNINGTDQTDMYQYYDACERDDYFAFTANGKYELNNNTQKCSPSDPQKQIGTWYFTNSDTKLNLSPYYDYLFDVLDIIELTETSLKLAYYTKNSSGVITRTHYIRLTH